MMGTVFLPTSAPWAARILCIAASAIADKLGSAKVANMVLLGALLEKLSCPDPATALAVIETKTGRSSLLEANRIALEEGRKFAEEFSCFPGAGSPAPG